ncbi:hypothetical protein GLOTRDRAFT_132689 [Gloeophyllum trabeum ATCC 11539]|uniref:MYND-type domain-containing protein n=1 Tax=Gloeophyllum trabeum (strain ATCC 11539 / FP-39264 / Madison 617) TaxID=670483 RepID=S7RH25_GLOTA|nr:uncharacterized protein GLOTRDRAFT_132689 [Gloeophyllum trabeum ATCC 11539]EPQ51879.1 hypothetical protein GLOTRDRAFT_132689 [Gloeophyllum trabeum ATCC 11539]
MSAIGLSTITSDPEVAMFHSAEPLHTHRHCKSCGQMRRCIGGDFKRCGGCHMATYCSKECQVHHWKTHKDTEYHHTSLINAALAAYLHKGGGQGFSGLDKDRVMWLKLEYLSDPALPFQKKFKPRGTQLVHRDESCDPFLKTIFAARPPAVDIGKVDLEYIPDTSLPYQKKFKPRGSQLMHKDDPKESVILPSIFSARETVVDIGKVEYGTQYAATGAYLLCVDFTPCGNTKCAVLEALHCRQKAREDAPCD